MHTLNVKKNIQFLLKSLNNEINILKYLMSFIILFIIVIIILGRVNSGMTVVKKIGMVETDKNDRPVDDVLILKGGIKM